MKQLIKKYHADPDAIIFSENKNEYLAVWGFDDIHEIHSNDKLNSGKLIELQNKINIWKRESDDIAAVGYLSYDSKNLFFPNLSFKDIKTDIPTVWFGKPKIIERVEKKLVDSYYPEVDINKYQDLASDKVYHKYINNIKSYMEEGDVYQINYTQPMRYKYKGKEIDLFRKLTKFSKPDYGAYLNLNEFQIISLSPEKFFTKIGNNISSSPIKGTRPRSNDKDRDLELLEELKISEKDRAEHLMIVDLIRNDLGKICKFGTVKTDNLFKTYSFETIHHMVTDVSGILKDKVSEVEIFNALFPGGSITGAPKQRAIQIIDEIENYSRGIYTGSIGFITASGDMQFNIAIRTLTLNGSDGVYPVGGGIVWDSKSNDERQEALDKSKVLEI